MSRRPPVAPRTARVPHRAESIKESKCAPARIPRHRDRRRDAARHHREIDGSTPWVPAAARRRYNDGYTRRRYSRSCSGAAHPSPQGQVHGIGNHWYTARAPGAHTAQAGLRDLRTFHSRGVRCCRDVRGSRSVFLNPGTRSGCTCGTVEVWSARNEPRPPRGSGAACARTAYETMHAAFCTKLRTHMHV